MNSSGVIVQSILNCDFFKMGTNGSTTLLNKLKAILGQDGTGANVRYNTIKQDDGVVVNKLINFFIEGLSL